jgi:hypothetical protein
MNCKQVEKLLPLFGSDDLSARLQQPLSRHLKSCASCAAAAGDYRQSSELLQEFAVPVFSDDLFAEMRRNVWQQIKAEPAHRSLTEMLRAWLHPPIAPMVWAAAIALLVAVLAGGIYFMGRGVSAPPPIARPLQPEAFHGTPEGASHTEKPTAPLSPGERRRDQRQADFGRSRPRLNRLDRRAPDLTPSLALNSPDAATSKREGSQVNSSFDPRAAVSGSEKTLRLEMQTRNPNIRIIWFTQKEPKSLSPNSKGT